MGTRISPMAKLLRRTTRMSPAQFPIQGQYMRGPGRVQLLGSAPCNVQGRVIAFLFRRPSQYGKASDHAAQGREHGAAVRRASQLQAFDRRPVGVRQASRSSCHLFGLLAGVNGDTTSTSYWIEDKVLRLVLLVFFQKFPFPCF